MKKLILSVSLVALAACSALSAVSIGSDCTFKGKKLYGKIQIVSSFPDLKIQFVTSFPDIKIKYVDSFPGR